MARMNWTKPENSNYEPGVYLAEIRKCELKHSKKSGDPYLNVEWHDLADPFETGGSTLIGWDILMMDGKGRGLSQAKLKVLGFDEGQGEIMPEDLVGRRAWVTWEWQEFNGEKRLKVASTFRPEFSCGYRHESQPPENASTSTAPIGDEDIPF